MKMAMSIVKIEIRVPELVHAVSEFKKNSRSALETVVSEAKKSLSTSPFSLPRPGLQTKILGRIYLQYCGGFYPHLLSQFVGLLNPSSKGA